MMKKHCNVFWSLALVLCLALSLFACNGSAPAVSTTAPAPDPTAPTPWLADEAAIQAATELAPANDLTVGIWVTPRPQLMTTQEEADARYAELKNAGVNMVYSFYETADREHLHRMLTAAQNNGISVIIDLSPTVNDASITANLEIVNFTKDYPAVIGYCMQDEPSATSFALLGKEYTAIREAVGEDMIIMCNLLPNYASKDQLGLSAMNGMTLYQTYLDQALSLIKSDILSFDYYPFSTNTTNDNKQIAGMVENLSDIASTGSKYGVPTWGFVQSASYPGRRIPNANELRFLSHLHLIFGLESYSYFLYSQPDEKNTAAGGFDGMLTYNGERTPMYDTVKANNKDISGLQGRYLDYELKGFYTANLSDLYRNSIPADLKLDSFGPLASAESQKSILIGCFENDKGEQAYYVLNFNWKNTNRVSLRFSALTDFTLWGADGIEAMGGQNELVLDLLPGEGKFIELKTFTQE